jgi:hypothetical protein
MNRSIPWLVASVMVVAGSCPIVWTGCGLDADRRTISEARGSGRNVGDDTSAGRPSRVVAAADEPWTSGIAGHSSGSHSMIVYTVRWGRAEELAQTLEPILKARYGEEARVVPHAPSNKLFLYIPSQRPEDARRARPPAAPAR